MCMSNRPGAAFVCKVLYLCVFISVRIYVRYQSICVCVRMYPLDPVLLYVFVCLRIVYTAYRCICLCVCYIPKYI
jgi:hypothetical protein